MNVRELFYALSIEERNKLVNFIIEDGKNYLGNAEAYFNELVRETLINEEMSITEKANYITRCANELYRFLTTLKENI